MSALPVTLPVTFPSKFATKVPVVIVKLPVLAPVNDPVPTMNLSADSSQPINALSLSPLSSTIPISLPGVPVVPLPNSISLSDITEFVVASVVVVPLTVKLPVTVALPPIATLLLNVAAPASDMSKVRAVTSEPPSLPLKIKSLSLTFDFNTKSLDEFVNEPIVVPSSLKYHAPLPASKRISLATSKTKLLLEAIVNKVPLPSIFSPSSPNVNPTFAGILTSFVAVKSISAVLVMAAITGLVNVLFVSVSVVSFKTIVPVASGIVTVLSAVGSATVKVVSCASSVAPSNVILLSSVIVVKLPGVAPPVTSVKKATVPLAFWNVIVLSAVGSTTVKVVSLPSAVAPSNVNVPPILTLLLK